MAKPSLIGPVFFRELVTAPRRPKLFVLRTLYAAVLFGAMCTAWLVLTGTQVVRTAADMARFGSVLFSILAPLQLSIIAFIAALSAASAVSQEKDRKTLILLLLTRLNNCELVLGRLCASLLQVSVMLVAGIPVLGLATLFGGVSFAQIARVLAVTFLTAVTAGSLGSTFALWREKTFQTLSLTALSLVAWFGLGEALHAGVFGSSLLGMPAPTIAIWLSPLRAVLDAARSMPPAGQGVGLGTSVFGFIVFAAGLTIGLNLIAILRVRIWNPSREPRRGLSAKALAETSEGEPDIAAPRHRHRPVWKNPILWREMRTMAYGRKVIVIRLIYVLLAVAVGFGSIWGAAYEATHFADDSIALVLPAQARPLIPFFVLSLVIINAVAVTSITTERDGRALDLLLVTDLTPKEFFLGKLGGVFWVAKEMIVVPIGLSLLLWWKNGISGESLILLTLGLVTMDVFVAALGIHCGCNYANSRSAIGVSLGTVFFLFLGITTCILMMISFGGSFNLQLPPFVAFIVGGGFGLFYSLGSRNQSRGLFAASMILPFFTFYAIVSFFVGLPLAVFSSITFAYGFATLAMMIPAFSEFDFAMGRTGNPEE